MPPKKRQKPTVTIQSDYVDSLPDQVTLQHTTPDRISQLQLARAYGLAPPGKNADIQTVDLLRSCPPKWTPSARVEESQSKPKPPEETQVISLVDDDDDEDDISMQKTKVTNAKVVVKKGKGKAKAAEVEFKPRVCSSENCSSAPKCLNWLGQDKWENSGVPHCCRRIELRADPATSRLQHKLGSSTGNHSGFSRIQRTTEARMFLLV